MIYTIHFDYGNYWNRGNSILGYCTTEEKANEKVKHYKELLNRIHRLIKGMDASDAQKIAEEKNLLRDDYITTKKKPRWKDGLKNEDITTEMRQEQKLIKDENISIIQHNEKIHIHNFKVLKEIIASVTKEYQREKIMEYQPKLSREDIKWAIECIDKLETDDPNDSIIYIEKLREL